ncbi:hypothetical protein [Paenibacillus sp. J2TS4]|uniref:hypothetical protein n=1 Tax=Paenibacillus sp. J2TS4 TaxID=2807194 RepID=UPI001B14BD2B|nr:hypothetical protein [Paenibacillus sp. J2TS4]GIP34843.1 hypothetical protein J2TS4_40530 [Paenibacillus sp. J2TS4]
MTDEEKNAETGPELAKLQTAAAAFTVVGLVLIVTALPPLIALPAQLLAFSDVMTEGMVRSWLETGVEGTAQLPLGIFLLLGPRGRSAGLNQIRGLGLKPPEQ